MRKNSEAGVITLALAFASALPSWGGGAEPPGPGTPFRVRDYGALPGAATDMGPGIRTAIRAALTSGQPAEVVFEEGIYHLGSEPDGEWALSLEGARDLTLRGAGPATELLITNPQSGGIRLSRANGSR